MKYMNTFIFNIAHLHIWLLAKCNMLVLQGNLAELCEAYIIYNKAIPYIDAHSDLETVFSV
jgi:hypothetical protein